MLNRSLVLFSLLACPALARGINLHVYEVDAKGTATALTVLEVARIKRCSGELANHPDVTSCQRLGSGELYVIHKARLRFVVGGKTKWERALPGPVAFQGEGVIAIEVKGGLDVRWLDVDGNTTRTESLHAAAFKPPDWCGDQIHETYVTVSSSVAAAVCLVLD